MAERTPLNYSGIFLDSADLVKLKVWRPILGGATTNPVILQKEGVLNIPEHIAKMVEVTGPNFPISVEIPDTNFTQEEMVDFGKKCRDKFPKNAVIKVAIDPREPEKAFEVIFRLGQDAVCVNATVGLTVVQLTAAAEALRLSRADGDNYISQFWARWNDARDKKITELVESGMDISEAQAKEIDAATGLAITINYLERHSLKARIIVGSLRKVDQIESALRTGADIVTLSPTLIKESTYSSKGIETVDYFNHAYRQVKDKVTLI